MQAMSGAGSCSLMLKTVKAPRSIGKSFHCTGSKASRSLLARATMTESAELACSRSLGDPILYWANSDSRSALAL